MSAIDLPEIPVWDPLVRVFHWTLVISFCAAYLSEGELFEAVQDRLSGEGLQLVHVWAGYLIAGMLLWRVVWGFVGPRHARFSDFVRGPRESLGYLKDALTLRAARYLGHNPAGGAMIVALLLSLAATIGVPGDGLPALELVVGFARVLHQIAAVAESAAAVQSIGDYLERRGVEGSHSLEYNQKLC